MSERRALKDEAELHKLFLELPKVGVTIVAFFATACALILRLSDGGGWDWLGKSIYLGGILVTIWMFNRTYNFLAQIVDNAVTKDTAAGHDEKFDAIKDKEYIRFKQGLVTAVFVWIVILVGLVTLT